MVDVMDIDESDDSLFIDHEQGPFRDAVRAEYAVFVCDSAMGPEI